MDCTDHIAVLQEVAAAEEQAAEEEEEGGGDGGDAAAAAAAAAARSERRLGAMRAMHALLAHCKSPAMRGRNKAAALCNSLIHCDGLHWINALQQADDARVARLATQLMSEIVPLIW